MMMVMVVKTVIVAVLGGRCSIPRREIHVIVDTTFIDAMVVDAIARVMMIHLLLVAIVLLGMVKVIRSTVVAIVGCPTTRSR